MRAPGRKLIVWLTAALLLSGGGYLLIFSSFFLTYAVLPLVSVSSGVEISAREVELHVWSRSLAVSDLRIGPEKEPYFTAKNAHCQYEFFKLLRGVIAANHVVVDGGCFQLRRSDDEKRTWYCGPLRRDCLPASSSAELSFSLHDIILRDSRFRMMWREGDNFGKMEISSLNSQVQAFENGNAFVGKLTGSLALSGSEANHIDCGALQLEWRTKLDDALIPTSSELLFSLEQLQGVANGEPFQNASLKLEFNGRREHDRLFAQKLQLTQKIGDKIRSSLDFSGDMSPEAYSAQGNVRVCTLSPELIAFGSELFLGVNPGIVRLDYTGNFDWNRESLSAKGHFVMEREGDARMTTGRLFLPPMLFRGKHDFCVNWQKKQIDLQAFELKVWERKRLAATVSLQNPVNYSWGGEVIEGMQQAVVNFDFRDLDLLLTKFAINPACRFQVDGGTISARMKLQFEHNLKSVKLSSHGRVLLPAWTFEGKAMALSSIDFGAESELLTQDWSLLLRYLSLSLQNGSQELAAISVDGQWNLREKKGQIAGKIERIKPEFVSWYAPAEVRLPELWHRLGVGSGELRFDTGYDWREGVLDIRKLEAVIPWRDREFFVMRTTPFRFDARRRILLRDVNFTLSGGGNAVWMEPLFRQASPWKPEEGVFSWKLDGALAKNFTWALGNGEIKVERLALNHGRIRDLAFLNTFSCYVHDLKSVEIKQMNFYLRRQGRPAMRLECPGNWDTETGRYRGNWEIRYLNEEFLSLFFPELVSEAQIFGKIQVNADDQYSRLKIAGAVDCELWRPVDPNLKPFSGKLLAVYEQSPDIIRVSRAAAELTQQDRKILDVEGSGEFSRKNDAPGAFALNFETLSLDVLLPLLQAVSPAPRESSAQSSPPALHFGKRPLTLGIQIKHGALSPELAFAGSAQVVCHENAIRSEKMEFKLNEAAYSGAVEAKSVPEGIRWSVDLQGGRERLALRPVTELILDQAETGLQGWVGATGLRLEGLDTGRPGSWAQFLSGNISVDFHDLKIPSGIGRGPIGRLFLLPIDVVAQCIGFLPKELERWKERFSFFGTNDSGLLTSVDFTQGEVRLKIDQGVVEVDFCRFSGWLIRRLSFEGNFQLFGREKLMLNSFISSMGGQMVVPIRGSLEQPDLDLSGMAVESAENLFRKLKEFKVLGLSAIGDVKSGSGEALVVVNELPVVGTINRVRKIFSGWFKREWSGWSE